MKKLKNILLIDDDEITCYLTNSFFEAMEIFDEVYCVHDGLEALEYLQQLSEEDYPDLIFLDIHMPVMNGFEFLESLEKYEDINTKKLYIVMLTTSDHKFDKDKASSFGNIIKCFITKPLTADRINELINSMPVK